MAKEFHVLVTCSSLSGSVLAVNDDWLITWEVGWVGLAGCWAGFW